MKKIAIIINGLHGLNKNSERILSLLEQDPAFSCTRMLTTAMGDAHRFTVEAIDKNFQVILAVGGDGTVNEVITGIMVAGQPVLFGVLPNGTGNDFSRSIQIFNSGNELKKSIHEQLAQKIDVGKITVDKTEHYFLNIADIGFGGKAIHILNHQRKWIKGTRSYPLAILRTFLFYRRAKLELKTDTNAYSGEVFMAAICNGKVFASGITINPFADPGNGTLSITLLKRINFFHYLKYLKRLKRGETIDHPQVEYWQCKEMNIKILSGNALCEADGESVSEGNYNIKVIPGAVTLLQPH